MSILTDISIFLQQGETGRVKELVQQALDEGISPQKILNEGLMDGMDIIGEKFKNNEVFIPEVLISARAMNTGIELLKSHLVAAGVASKGVAIIGTVKGDLHDIGKNLVKIMMESKGLTVIDLGVDVSPERFYEAAQQNQANIVCCSALLTTTMIEMKNVVNIFIVKEKRDSVKIMVGGAPLSKDFCEAIGADCYEPDAASAAQAASDLCS
ncbi:MAG: corrinoid protein [Dehalococcoidia bacterium]|jgi:methanogenic corrinoid protein MtbC1